MPEADNTATVFQTRIAKSDHLHDTQCWREGGSNIERTVIYVRLWFGVSMLCDQKLLFEENLSVKLSRYQTFFQTKY